MISWYSLPTVATYKHDSLVFSRTHLFAPKATVGCLQLDTPEISYAFVNATIVLPVLSPLFMVEFFHARLT